LPLLRTGTIEESFQLVGRIPVEIDNYNKELGSNT